jgi:predicted PurR-regulated permease PerM
MQVEFRKIQTIAFFAVLLGVGFLFFRVIAPYVYPLFWAAVIAALFAPLYHRLKEKFKNENAAAGVTLVIILLVVILPLAGFLGIVVKQAIDIYATVSQPETIASVQESVRNLLARPEVQDFMTRFELDQKLKEFSENAGGAIVGWLTASSKSTVTVVIQFFITLYTLFFFLKDGEMWLRKIMFLLPFGDDNEKVLYKKFVSTSKATLKGTILIGGIQGTIGGILFLVVGIPSAAFWGLVMIVMAIIPAVGPAIVWIPAAGYMLATGHIWQAVVLIAGGLFMGVIDNVLRPPLVGKDIEMHPLLILFSTIGGLSMFGISGVVIGPLIASFFLAILQIYEHRYNKELKSSET